MATVTEIAPNVYRFSVFTDAFGLQFNHFLALDDEPVLIHAGMRLMFDELLASVRTIIDPARLRWIGGSHFEPDEWGALNSWLAVAPNATPVSGAVGAKVMLEDFADRSPRALAEDEVLTTGRRRWQFLASPHVPHGWDAGLFHEATDRVLFCSDLFGHRGAVEPIIESGLMDRVRPAIAASRTGPLALSMPYTPQTTASLARLADLKPQTLALMHGSTFRGDGARELGALSTAVTELLGPVMD